MRERQCNGGPNGVNWCGATATHVARDEDGLEWFCCEKHSEGAGQRADTRLVLLADWHLLNRMGRSGGQA